VLDSTFCDCARVLYACSFDNWLLLCVHQCSFKFSMPAHAVMILVWVAFISCVWCKHGY
jgi:hypothetical protein